MTERYYLPPDRIASRPALTDAEAHHFLHVMRGKPGESIVLFDGAGCEFEAVVLQTTRREVEVEIVARREVPRDLPLRLDIVAPLPKGDRSRWMVEKLTELGAASLTPLATERSGPQPSGQSLEKLRRYSIEACKQSGRNRLPALNEPCTWDDLQGPIAWLPTAAEALRLVAHPYQASGGAGSTVAQAAAAKRPIIVALGPEGGLTDAEVDAARDAGWHAVTLGRRILRVETAAVALAALVSLHADAS